MDVGPILDYRTLDSLMWFFNDVFHCLLMVFCYFLSIKLYAGRCKRMEYFVSIYKKIVGWSRLRGRGAWRRWVRDSGAMGTLSPAPLGPGGPVLLGEMGGFSVHCSETRRDPDPPRQRQLCPFLWPRSIVHKWCVTVTELYNILWYTSRQGGTVRWNSDGVLDLSQIPLGCRPNRNDGYVPPARDPSRREKGPRTGSQVKHLQQARDM